MVRRDHKRRLIQDTCFAIRVLDIAQVSIKVFHEGDRFVVLATIYMAQRPVELGQVNQGHALVHLFERFHGQLGRQRIFHA
jgi:hypothetical protein